MSLRLLAEARPRRAGCRLPSSRPLRRLLPPSGGSPLALLMDASQDRVTAPGYSGRPSGFFTGRSGARSTLGPAGSVVENGDLLATAKGLQAAIPCPTTTASGSAQQLTCTGLTHDGAGNLVIASFGAPLGTPSIYYPSLVRIDFAGNKLSEWPLRTAFPSLPNESHIQGVARDSTDGSYWIAHSAPVDRVSHMTAAGGDAGGSFVLTGGPGANGIAYDSLRDRLYVGNSRIDRITKAGASEANFTPDLGAQAVDHLFYDAPRDWLWVTHAANGVTGMVNIYRCSDFSVVATGLKLLGTTAIEGIVMFGGRIYVCHDGYYHSAEASPPVNRIHVYAGVSDIAASEWALDHDAAGNAKGWFIESASTRLHEICRWSETIGRLADGCTYTGNLAGAPNGLPEVTRATATASGSPVSAYGARAGAASVASVRTVIWNVVRAGTHPYFKMGERNRPATATFDLSTGAVIGQDADVIWASATALGDGWYLCQIAFVAPPFTAMGIDWAFALNAHVGGAGRATFAWTGSETLELWTGGIAQQDQLGSFLPHDDQRTRATDTFSVPVTAWDWSPSENVIEISARAPRGTGTNVLAQLDDGSEANRIRIVRNTTRELRLIVTTGGVEQANINLGTVADEAAFKLAARIKANDVAVSLNGAAVLSDTAVALPTVTTLRPGGSFTGEQWAGWISRLRIAPELRANDNLAALAA